jgi:pseudaminic acid synthase
MPSIKPVIVAELSANHLGIFDRAIAIIDAAKKAGADAVKLQTYRSDLMVADVDYEIPSGPWKGEKLVDLYDKAMTPWTWHEALFHYCAQIGIECFSSPFDEKAVAFLEQLNCPRYKVASFELTDHQLIRRIAETCKPIVLSVGMGSVHEIEQAVQAVRCYGSNDITLLKCTSSYPATAKDANLLTMMDMVSRYNCKVGISDHTPGTGTAIAAAMMGAAMIEKHLTLDDQPTPDSGFSLRPNEFQQLVEECHRAVDSIGTIHYGPLASEADSVFLRRSIYAIRTIYRGEALSPENIGLRRPAKGLHPLHWDRIIGKTAKEHIDSGTPIKLGMFD